MKWGIAALASMAFLAGAWAREESTPITNGQGEIAGEVTTESVILQSRLTTGDTWVDGDLPVSVRSDHVAESRKAREPWCIPPEERSTKEARDGDRQKRGDIEIIGKAALVGVGCAGGGVGMAT